jgi:hypothetical protein
MKKSCVCTIGDNCCNFSFDGWFCTRAKDHSGDHVACCVNEHHVASCPNDTKNTLNQLTENLKKFEATATAIQELQKRQDELFKKHVEPLAGTERDKNWLWDYCFNKPLSDDYGKMVEKKVLEILCQHLKS